MKTLEYYKALSEELALELEKTQEELEALRNQEPVAWMHDQPGRIDVIHKNIKWILDESQRKYGFKSGVSRCTVDKTEHYTIPLYRKPVYEKSFTLIGAGTVYGDQEMITQIERKFGIKPHLKLVE